MELQCLRRATEVPVDLGKVVKGTRLAGHVPDASMYSQRVACVRQRLAVVLGMPMHKAQLAQGFGFPRPVRQRAVDFAGLLGGFPGRRNLAEVSARTGLAQERGGDPCRIVQRAGEGERLLDGGALFGAPPEPLEHRLLQQQDFAGCGGRRLPQNRQRSLVELQGVPERVHALGCPRGPDERRDGARFSWVLPR